MEPTTLTVEHPGAIDADPEMVGWLAIQQLLRVLKLADELFPATIVQARSSYQTQHLNQNSAIPASELAVVWIESKLMSELTRARGALELAVTLCESAQEKS